jgi:hypothetical protein
MRRARRSPAALALVALITLVGAGCGSSSGGDTTAVDRQETTGSAADNAAATAPADSGSRGGSASSTRRERAVAFAECMRANGVGAFPDPDASGDLTIDGVLNGSSLDASSAAWKQAVGACKDLQPPGFTGTKATTTQMTARLKFAQCMRGNGVKDFPDPTKDGPLVDTNRIPSSATPGGMSNLNAAMRTCGDFIADQVGKR